MIFSRRNERLGSPALIEQLETRRLLSGDPSIVQALPYTLEFDQKRGGIRDKDGSGTGFTYIFPNATGTEYQPSLIDLRTGAGLLRVTSAGNSKAGSNFETDNSLVNGLTATFAAATKNWTISTRLIGPLGYIDTPNEQAGLLFGVDQDNWVKLTVATTSSGVGLQFLDEQRFKTVYKHSLSANVTNIGSLNSVNTLDLLLSGNVSTGQINAFYSINGGAVVQLAQKLVLTGDKRTAFFSATAHGGLMVIHKNDLAPLTVAFDRFEMHRGLVAGNGGGGTISTPARRIFNDIRGGGSSKAQTVSIKNTGTGSLTIPANGVTLSGTDAGQFSISGAPGSNVTLAPGQSLPISVTFHASSGTSLTIKTATISIKSNDPNAPTKNVRLRGLATAGIGGTNEPSLQRIMDLWEIPITVGDTNPDDVYLDDPPHQPNDEILLPHLQRAGPGPVTISPLAVFGVTASPALTFGTYEPGTPANRTELFLVPKGDEQTVAPTLQGSASFDPGSAAFSFYSTWPGFKNSDGSIRTLYSEDIFNAFDTHSMRKMRFCPLKNSDGSAVPNAYVVANEEFNAAYDNQDFVAVVSNVKAAAGGAEIGVESLDGPPAPDRLVFNNFQQTDPNFPNTAFHGTAKVRVRNSGSATLVVDSTTVSGPFKIVSPASGFSVSPGNFVDVKVQFMPSTLGVNGGTLTIRSNDADESSKTVSLAGFFQKKPEGGNEPQLPTIGQLLGYSTAFVYGGQALNGGGKVEAIGDEILSPYWVRADQTQPVRVRQLAAFHTQGNTATINWFNKGTRTTTKIFTCAGVDAQTFYPRKDGNLSAVAEGTFTPSTTPFGFRIDNEWSDNTFNPQEKPGGGYGHHVRFYPVRDARGFFVSNTFLMVMDYNGVNYDYNDNTYLISNMRPEKFASPPVGLGAVQDGSAIHLDWGDSSDVNFIGFSVYRSTQALAKFTLLTNTPITASEFIDTTAAPGVRYYYRVVTQTSSSQSVPSSTSGIIA